jgi:hypothetical protein
VNRASLYLSSLNLLAEICLKMNKIYSLWQLRLVGYGCRTSAYVQQCSASKAGPGKRSVGGKGGKSCALSLSMLLLFQFWWSCAEWEAIKTPHLANVLPSLHNSFDNIWQCWDLWWDWKFACSGVSGQSHRCAVFASMAESAESQSRQGILDRWGSLACILITPPSSSRFSDCSYSSTYFAGLRNHAQRHERESERQRQRQNEQISHEDLSSTKSEEAAHSMYVYLAGRRAHQGAGGSVRDETMGGHSSLHPWSHWQAVPWKVGLPLRRLRDSRLQFWREAGNFPVGWVKEISDARVFDEIVVVVVCIQVV